MRIPKAGLAIDDGDGFEKTIAELA